MNNGLLGLPRGASPRLRRKLHQHIRVEEQQPATTQGGSAPSTLTWFTRTLNTLAWDETGVCRLDTVNSRLRIPAGKYRCWGGFMAFFDFRFRGRVYDITNSRVLAFGTTSHAHNTAYGEVQAPLVGSFECQGDIEIVVQQIVQGDANQAWDIGHYGSGSEIETYVHLDLIRIGY